MEPVVSSAEGAERDFFGRHRFSFRTAPPGRRVRLDEPSRIGGPVALLFGRWCFPCNRRHLKPLPCSDYTTTGRKLDVKCR